MRLRDAQNNVEFAVGYLGRIPANRVAESSRLRRILLNLRGNTIKVNCERNLRLIVRLGRSEEARLGGSREDRPDNQRLIRPVIEKAGAELNGAAGGYGFSPITEAARAVERQAKEEVELE